MIFPKTTRRQKSYWIVKSTSIERIIYSSKKVFQLHVKRTYTFWVSHFLHCCWRNHDRHWNLEAQDSCWHVNLANINKNAWPKSIFRGKSGEMREEQTINLKSRKIYVYIYIYIYIEQNAREILTDWFVIVKTWLTKCERRRSGSP